VGEIEDWSKEIGSRGSRSVNNWRETPYRLISTTMAADQLSVPELKDYLEYNSDFSRQQLAPYRTNLHYRWALPAACLSVVLIAAPLGIIYSRRAVLASVAASLFIFFGYLFLMFLMLALGKGDHVSPAVAAWTPDAVLAVIGCYLLYLRSTNRELPRFSFGRS
jgi:lipopolysaccharide export system permease protein